MKFLTRNGAISVGETVRVVTNGKDDRLAKVRHIDADTLMANVYVQDLTGGYTIEISAHDLEPVSEQIKKPDRYNKRGKLECWDVIIDQEMNFLEGNVLKYVWRYKEKNGVEDLKKAKVYLDKLISEVEKK